MALNAEKFLQNAESILPGIELAAKLTGRKVLVSIAAILRRAIENPESKEQLLTWLRYTPVFTGETAVAEPSLPEAFADLQEQAIDMRVGCQECDDDDDCDNPTDAA